MPDRIRWLALPALAFAFTLAPVAQAPAQPSFDCAKARPGAEQMICRSDNLASQDDTVAWLYRRLRQHSEPKALDGLLKDQRAWLAHRDACRDEACLAKSYEARDDALRDALARRDLVLRAAVARPGACQVTKIDFLGPRLEGAPDSGSSVGFANGVWQVSYDVEAGLTGARLGDPAKVCLVSIPKGCPQGDDRGRIYTAVNQRTGGKWKAPDAEHGCGGA